VNYNPNAPVALLDAQTAFLSPYLSDAINNGAPIATPDEDSWFAMADYYNELLPLIKVLDEYIQGAGISHVYVSGHSLGAAMVERFMADHPDQQGVQFQAVTFANPGYQTTANPDPDTRITNIDVSGDSAPTAPWWAPFVNQWFLPLGGNYQERGDEYTVVNSGGNINGGGLHDMALYAQTATFLSNNYQAVIDAYNGSTQVNEIKLYAKISYGTDGWDVTLPTGNIDGSDKPGDTEFIRTGETSNSGSTVTTHGANDIVTFGPGNDTFVFTESGGQDTLVNYKLGVDTIEIQLFFEQALSPMVAVHNYGELESLMHQSGGDVVIDFGKLVHGQDTLTIKNTTIDNLHNYQDHFLFV
jgi:pimeloyl-ACP methyl ester carboxylesterase